MTADVRPLVPASDARWWLDRLESRRGETITRCAREVWKQCEPSRSAMLSAWRLYSSQPLIGSGSQPRLYRRRTMGTVGQSTLSLNVVKAVLDTYTAQLVKDEPGVMFQTKGGSASIQRKAQALERFVDGVFYEAKFYERLPQFVLDSALFPFGGVRPYEDYRQKDKPRITIDRIMAWEYVADAQDASDGNPSTPYLVRTMDRLAAMATWPQFKDQIRDNAMSAKDFDKGLVDYEDGSALSDPIVIIEAWHLGAGDEDPGRHTICSGDVVLFDEEWDRDTTGVELLYRLLPTTGIWSSSLAEELKGIQREINTLLSRLKHAHALTASGHWLVEQNSNLNVNTLDNQQGSIWRYKGVPPQFFPGGTVPAEIYAHLDRLYQRAFEIIGVSQSIAQGQTPQLNGSGKAIIAYADVQSQRFKPSYRQLQSFVVRVALECIGCARRIAKKHPSFGVKAPGKMMQAVAWADANLADNEFVVQPKAINKLAEDPVGVLDQIQNFANAGPGWMMPSDARRLMSGVPDLQAWADEMNAARNLVEQICDKMLETGKYIAPDPFLPLDEKKVGPDNAIRWVHLRLLKGVYDEEDSERLDLLRRWLTEADATVQEQQAATAPPPQQLPPGAAMGAPPPPPVPPQPQAAAA